LEQQFYTSWSQNQMMPRRPPPRSALAAACARLALPCGGGPRGVAAVPYIFLFLLYCLHRLSPVGALFPEPELLDLTWNVEGAAMYSNVRVFLVLFLLLFLSALSFSLVVFFEWTLMLW
jgi:hypothetical protein